ncbi:phage P2 GpU family protein [Asticcacaulis biprosthecium C19]|uniref:Phage P2 GpU family protein n=1 Tax=Asticcacaulis biprosthecium C19 TaxID=715226 RepID=F4QJB3_9CAUL|nr:phage tail protein [Asticcacaulis biprosthecium]EGF93096.1 phage P2 GpU family protein [Asticcacaulis biprosthecium C19]
MHMMSLGMFIFEIGTLAYQELQRKTAWRHARGERFGALATAQYLGPGDDTISLPGVLYPGQIGDYSAISRLREMGNTGDAQLLCTGYGDVLGEWLILSLDETQSLFFEDGAPRKVAFTLELSRAPDSDVPPASPATVQPVTI